LEEFKSSVKVALSFPIHLFP